MTKRILIYILIIAMLFPGCQLAKEDAGEQQRHDRLIGVFVTKEHLDLFDFEAYFNDHANELISGGNTMIENTDGYQQRIYANMENAGCAFEGMDGILFASYAFDDGVSKGYRNAPGNMVNGHVNWDETENQVTLTMNGTIYISDKIGYIQYFYNPVRQDSEGRLYLTAGTGLSTNVTEGTGMKNWHDLSDEYTITVNGETQSYRADITIGVEAIVLPELYTFYYMDENHLELGRDVFSPEDMPLEICPLDDAAYILVEESSHRKDNTERTFRTIYSRGQDEVLDIYIPGEDYVCTKSNTKIIW